MFFSGWDALATGLGSDTDSLTLTGSTTAAGATFSSLTTFGFKSLLVEIEVHPLFQAKQSP